MTSTVRARAVCFAAFAATTLATACASTRPDRASPSSTVSSVSTPPAPAAGWLTTTCPDGDTAVHYDDPARQSLYPQETLLWVLSPREGDGVCHLYGASLPPGRLRATVNDIRLRARASFPWTGRRCLCREVRTEVDEGFFPGVQDGDRWGDDRLAH